jgi:hypothetical protein
LTLKEKNPKLPKVEKIKLKIPLTTQSIQKLEKNKMGDSES